MVLFTLLWLKHHNKYYRDVRINADELGHLQVNGGLSNLTFVENSTNLEEDDQKQEETGGNWDHLYL